MDVADTCAQRGRWSRLRMLATRASFVGGLAAGAWLCMAAAGSASPVSEQALTHNIESSMARTDSDSTDSPSATAEDTTEAETQLVSVERPAEVRPAIPETPDPVEPAAPEIMRPDAVEITPPAVLTVAGSPDDEATSKLADETPPALAPPPTPEPTAASTASNPAEPPAEIAKTATPSSKRSEPQAQSPEAHEPHAPAGEQERRFPTPVQLPPVPTMTSVGSATGPGGGPRVLAIMPSDTWQHQVTATAVVPRPSHPLRSTLSVEPSTSPD